MPLPPATSRQPHHQRQITCQGYLREDGLWDVEGCLIDTRSEIISTFGRGDISPGEHLHEMWIRMTVDSDLKVTDLLVHTEKAPYPACPHIPDHYKKLIGETIAPGWTAKVRLLIGGTRGCTHIAELLGPVATTAVQTVYAWRGEQDGSDHTPPVEFMNTCHSLAEDGVAASQLWPKDPA